MAKEKKTDKTLKKEAKEFAKDTAKEIKKHQEENSLPAVDITQCETAIEEAMMDLIYDEPFYAEMIMRFRREITTKVPTLAVGPRDNEIYLYISPYFFCGHNRVERVAFLKHECLHVVNNHFVRFRDLEPQIYENPKDRTREDRIQDMTQASLLNQAADYAINEYIHNLPKKVKVFNDKGVPAIYPDKLPDGTKCKDAGKPIEADLCLVEHLKKKINTVEHEQNFEYYYRVLKEKQDEDEKNGQGEGQGQGPMTLDDHGTWHESDMDEDSITDKVKEIVNRSAEAAQERKAGSISSEVQQLIDNLNHVPKDWRNDIQRFVARSAEILVEPCRKKRNRRYGILYPGHKKEPIMNLVVPIDASGSVAEEELAQFFAEIKRLHSMNINITIVEFDTQVNAVYAFDPKKEIKIHGRGGTHFKPALDLISSREFKSKWGDPDGIIFFTDGGCFESEDSLTKPRVPLMWALVQTDDIHISWGYRTKVEVKKKVRR